MSNKKPIYLDNASTTPACAPTLRAMDLYYKRYKANVHRGLYDTAIKATEIYEGARSSIAKFINAEREEIIFTSGTTHSLNQLAYSLAPRLSHRDNVVLTRLEHHANLVPWQQMAKHYGFEIRFIELKEIRNKKQETNKTNNSLSPIAYRLSSDNFKLDLNSAKKLIDENTKIVSFTLASNVTGSVTPAAELIKITKQNAPRAITVIDAAQAAAHLPIDVRKLDCDFLAFSGHKMYGPTGIGVLYGKKEMLGEHLEPFFFGGEMVKEVTYETATWNDVPHKFEAGTPNIAGAIGLGAAVEWIMKTGWKKIQKHEQSLTNNLINQLTNNSIQIVGPGTTENRIGVVSFVIPTVHPHDLASILNNSGIAIRAGNHCAMPLHTHLGLTATARISIGLFNTKKDIDALIKGIKKAKKIFRN